MSGPLVTLVAGARPNFVKIAALLPALRDLGFHTRLVHTGQHYDYAMSQAFFEELELPEPDLYLGVGAYEPALQIARVIEGLAQDLAQTQPACLIVVGDVNSTVAAALCAKKCSVPVAHVEAGLRSFDRTMPEEINRIATDHLSDWLFATEPSAVENLRREGIDDSRIFLVGNVMIDTLKRYLPTAASRQTWQRYGLRKGEYVLVTLHRPSNVDDPQKLGATLEVLAEVGRELPVLFPVHPRTQKRLREAGLDNGFASRYIKMVEPMHYLDMISAILGARLVVTDSGGIQEETTYLGVPCITYRASTERPITVLEGTNEVVGTDPNDLRLALRRRIRSQRRLIDGQIELWDGNAAQRIAQTLWHALVGTTPSLR